jgi:hypothetical protein
MPEEALDLQLKALESLLGDLRGKRVSAESYLEALEAAADRIDQRAQELAALAALLSTPPAAATTLAQAVDEGLAPLRDAMADLVKEVNDPQPAALLADVQDASLKASAAFESLSKAIKVGDAAIQQGSSTVRKALQGSVEGLVSSSNTLAGSIEGSIAPVIQEIHDASDALLALLEGFRNGLSQRANEVEEDTATQLDAATGAIRREGERLIAGVADMSSQCVAGLDEIRAGVSRVTDQLQAILRLIEPIKPVLDAASRMA